VEAADDERWAPTVLSDAGEDDSDIYILGVRETAEDDSWSLVFMECDDDDAEDEQEIALGMDTYCLVVDPGQATFYGGVLECELTAGQLRLLLTEEAAKALGTPTELSFALAMDVEQVRMVSRGLARVLTSGRPDAVPRQLTV
jgi:Immunity protein 10